MAKQKKEENEEKKSKFTDQEMLERFLTSNTEDHYNFTEEKYFKISSGSLLLDSVLDGGFTPGLHRFVGFNSGGKTSEACTVLRNFLRDVKGSKGIFFAAEGRLNPDIKKRSGMKFVYTAKEWDVGTVFVYESNIYESVATLIENLISSDDGVQYGIIVDSVDGLSLKADLDKPYSDAAKVAGGPVIASVLMKRVSIPLSKKGHLAIFISQVRSEIVLDQYAPKAVRQITGTGGNALLHYANVILEFLPRYKGDVIIDNEKEAPSTSNPPRGHWAKVIVKKSSNDKNNYKVEYPIKYDGSKSGVWKEKEIIDSMLQWGDLEKSGSWFNFSEELIETGIVGGDKIQGLEKVYEYITKDPILVEKLYAYVSSNIAKAYSDEPSKTDS